MLPKCVFWSSAELLLLLLKIIGVLSENVAVQKGLFKKNVFVSLHINSPFPKGPDYNTAAANIPQEAYLLILHLHRTSKEG